MRVRIVLVLLLGLAAAGCGGGDASAGRMRVVAAFYPLAYAAEEIGGDGVDVRNLTPAGAEPHDFQISPGDVRALRSADLVLLLGRGFQPQLERAAGSGDTVVRLLETPGLTLRANGDPHVWLDPSRFERLAGRVGELLGQPSVAFGKRLRTLDTEFRRALSSCARREIVTSHEAFGYLAERYGLRQIAITGLSPEAEPTPAALAHVIALVRKTGATTIFFESLVSPEIAETVARETGAVTAKLDPVEGLVAAAAGNYFTLMRENLAALRRGLGCR